MCIKLVTWNSLYYDARSEKHPKVINKIFVNVNDWFKINLLSLNFDKTYYVQFRTKYIHEININIGYGSKLIINTHTTKFLGLITGNFLSWKTHIDLLMSKISTARYAVRAVKSVKCARIYKQATVLYSFLMQLILYSLKVRALVNAVMNLRVPLNAGNFLTSCKPVSFSRSSMK